MQTWLQTVASTDANKPFIRERHKIMDGAAEIVTTKTSGGNWQLRYRVSGEGKYVRKSLGTSHLPSAILEGRRQVALIMANEQAGKKIFGLKLYELKDKYLEYREGHVQDGYITKGRLGTIRSHLNHFLKFFNNSKIKLSELSRRSAFD